MADLDPKVALVLQMSGTDAYRAQVVAWLRNCAKRRHADAAATRGEIDCSSYDNDIRAQELDEMADAIERREPEAWAKECDNE